MLEEALTVFVLQNPIDPKRPSANGVIFEVFCGEQAGYVLVLGFS